MTKDQISANIHDQPLFTLAVDYDFTSLLALASIIFGVPVSFIWLKTENYFCFTDHIVLSEAQKENLLIFCNAASLKSTVNELHNHILDEPLPGGLSAIEHTGARFYSGFPLKDDRNNLIGAFFLLGPEEKVLTPDQETSIQWLKKDIIRHYVEKKEVQELKHYQNLLQISDSP